MITRGDKILVKVPAEVLAVVEEEILIRLQYSNVGPKKNNRSQIMVQIENSDIVPNQGKIEEALELIRRRATVSKNCMLTNTIPGKVYEALRAQVTDDLNHVLMGVQAIEFILGSMKS